MHRRTLAPLKMSKLEPDEIVKSEKKLIPISFLPISLQPMFPYEYFNAVQSECYHFAFQTNENLVISAPTGTGKTVVAELAIAHSLLEFYNNTSLQSSTQINTQKPPLIVYVSPLKSLCQERSTIWMHKFKEVPEFSDIEIIELTSDTQGTFPRKVKNPTIICTTPEKLDLATRSMKGSSTEFSISSTTKKIQRKNHKCSESFDQLSLVIFDEVHNMTDSRGAVLEAVMSRILFISEQNCLINSFSTDDNQLSNEENKIRIVALSATIRNYDDFKQWLKVKHNTIFDESYRSTKIDTRIFGYSTSSSYRSRVNDWVFESSLTSKVTPIIRQYSKNKPVLIFCCTRKSCERTAMKLATDFCPTQQDQIKIQKEEEINNALSNIRDKTLLLSIKSRVGIHTAGLCQSDRTIVEQLFMKNKIKYLCTTSTLSQGVNLPAYLVIIKGTKHFIDSSLEEYDSTQILQMQGRAGRPQFEKEGVCIIMTEKENVKKFEKMINQSDPIESSLLDNLEEHLNAEIALGFINDEDDVVRWLMSTFLYIRMQKNPFHYKLTDANNATKFLARLSVNHLKELEKHHFISYEHKQIYSQDVGSLCSQYGLLISTMILYNESDPPRTIKNALSLLCKSFEFANDIIVRQDEKQKLRLMSVQPNLRFLSDDSAIDNSNVDKQSSIFGNNNYTSEAKVFVLIDTVLSLGKIEEWSLSQEFSRIKRTSERLIACMLQLMVSYSKKSFLGAVNSAILLKCIKRQMWENESERLAQQVKGIGEVYAKKISNGYNSLKDKSQFLNNGTISPVMTMSDLRKMTSFQIDKLTNHRTGWGIQIVEEIQKIPEYSLSFKLQNPNKKSKGIKILINFTNLSHSDPISPYHKVDIFVGIKNTDLLIDYFHIQKMVGHFNKTFSIFLDDESIIPSKIVVYVIDSEYVGIDLCQNVVFNENDTVDFHENDTESVEEDEKETEFLVKSPYFNNGNNLPPKPKLKELADTYMTQYFKPEHKPIEISKQKVMAVCPELLDQCNSNDDECNDSNYEVVWPKTPKSSYSQSSRCLQDEKNSNKKDEFPSSSLNKCGNDNDKGNDEEVLWSFNKSNEKNIVKNDEITESENFKLDDDFWESFEIDEESN